MVDCSCTGVACFFQALIQGEINLVPLAAFSDLGVLSGSVRGAGVYGLEKGQAISFLSALY